MLLPQVCALLASASLVLSAPIKARQSNQNQSVISDTVILNYALTLELLESQFYTEALANFSEADFDAAGFVGVRDVVVEIGASEQTHASFLQSIFLLIITELIQGVLVGLGVAPVLACTYSFPVTDVTDFMALAQVVEG
jgi:Ferritin-like domain